MSYARQHWRVVGLIIAVALTAAAIAYVTAVRQLGVVERVGVASPAAGAISAEADGWTYNIPLDVPWTDVQGSLHDAGRPDCLSPDPGNVTVRFASVDVGVNGAMWRQVVWVDCRSAVAH